MIKKIVIMALCLTMVMSCQSIEKNTKEQILDLIPADGIIYFTFTAAESTESINIYKMLPLVFSDISDQQLKAVEEIDYCIICFNKLDSFDLSMLIKGNFPRLADFITSGQSQVWKREGETWYNPASSVFISEPDLGTYFIRTRPDALRGSTTHEQRDKFGKLLTIMHASNFSLSLYDMATVSHFIPSYNKLPFSGLTLGVNLTDAVYVLRITFMFSDKTQVNMQLENCKKYLTILLNVFFSEKAISQILADSNCAIDKSGNVTCTARISQDLIDETIEIIELLRSME